MAGRPILSDANLILAVFKPSKHAVPTGIHHTTVKLLKGRKSARVRAWNKFTPLQQEVIRRTGNRDKYLSGQVTYAEAKRTLRDKGVGAGLVKRTKTSTPLTPIKLDDVAEHLINLAGQRPASKTGDISRRAVRAHVAKMTREQRRHALLIQNYTQLTHEIQDEDTWFNEDWEVNLLWYK